MEKLKAIRTGLAFVPLISCILITLQFAGYKDRISYKKVYCPQCHRHLFSFTGEIKVINDLFTDKFKTTKLMQGFKKGDRFICPIEGAPINGWEFWAWKKDAHPPDLVYPALTVMIKKDGKFVFYPDDIEELLR